MPKPSAVPNVIIYSALASSYQKGVQISRVRNVFQSMLQLLTLPDVFTYNALISAFGKG